MIEFVTKITVIMKVTSVYNMNYLHLQALAKGCGTRPCQNNQRCIVNGSSYVCQDISMSLYFNANLCPVISCLDFIFFVSNNNSLRESSKVFTTENC